MKKHFRSVIIAAAILSGVALATTLHVMGATRPSLLGSHAAPGDNPTVESCIRAKGRNCNPDPSVYPTFLASNPVAQRPSPNPHYISEAKAIGIARGARTDAVARARLLSRSELEALDANLAANAVPDPLRKIWVVTVHADARTMGNPFHKPRTVHVYTEVIDAETGHSTDICLGCETLK